MAPLAFSGVTEGTEIPGIGLISLSGTTAPRMVIQESDAFVSRPTISPDGRFVAYESAVSGAFEVHVVEVATGKSWLVPSDEKGWGSGFPRWTRGGEGVVLLSVAQPFAVDVALGPALSFSAPYQLFTLPPFAKLAHDVTHDGERFLMVQRGSHLPIR
jgi:Tol biopolymer transport system component